MIRAALFTVAILSAVPAFAQTAGVAPASKPAAPMAAPAHPAAHGVVAPLDVNSATPEQLASVKGLDKSMVEAIVKGRPFKSLDELTKNKIIPEDAFAKVKEHLTVGASGTIAH
ncbi:ComEA family DNA-binding protein [Methylocystis bryophila]|uniref:ComEA family DNA-binding protein n=1 Tax=Methylocystis bryophila TaxID=655015 RepID=UPI000A26AEDF|nr:helix-hairpin-helix domain-containing protein [Methylocystis bryophila]BDV40504.1 hypothetical protein DSM21852_37570 [Methylocystis bryophila]